MKKSDTMKIATSLVMAFLLSACSGAKKTEGEEIADLDEIPTLDAGTDPVPMDGLEDLGTAPAVDPMLADPNSDLLAPPTEPQVDPAPEMAETAPATYEPEMAAATSTMGNVEDYTVQQGDTLMRLAFETYADVYQWRKIYDLNKDKIADPMNLTPGTVIKIEKPAVPVVIERNGDPYLIKWGDTLRTISSDVYGRDDKWRKIWDNNRQLIKDPNKIFAGFYLYYTMTPAEREEADRLKQQRGGAPAPLAETPVDTMGDPMAAQPSDTLRDPAAAANAGQAPVAQ